MMNNDRLLTLTFIILITAICAFIEHVYPKVSNWLIYPMATLYIIVITLLLTGVI
jgi:hypothetical protein